MPGIRGGGRFRTDLWTTLRTLLVLVIRVRFLSLLSTTVSVFETNVVPARVTVPFDHVAFEELFPASPALSCPVGV